MTSTAPTAAPQPKPPSNKVKYTVLGLFPFLLVTLFTGIFVTAMHQPTPNNLPVAVVGVTAEQGRDVAEALEKRAGEALDVRVVNAADTARQLVTDQEIAGAYILPADAKGDATLYVAGAAGASLEQMTTQIFAQVAEEQHTGLQTKDLVPLPSGDSIGTVSLYLSAAFLLAGFLFVIIASVAAPDLMEMRRLLPAAGGFAALIAVSATMLVGPVIGGFEDHVAQVMCVGWLTSFCASMVTAFFARYLGPLAVLVVAPLFMFLGVPASGGALTVYAEPGFFQFLHGVLPTPATLETIRSVIYFGGEGVGGHVTVLALWTVGGLAANVVAVLAKRRKARTGPPSAAALAH
ncbi:ABC transporter permease [Streptomyces sp. ID05-47C]|uniref:ABC transporter permease n=1 Tax=Streptomyces sp. ID05-47C TaxID=3028665 RepID=UPI0029AAE4A1|nr:ABC transporter permease [Streptomyces sp. ID05-47C]MDX3574133.1 hypothetical protein [Streptomyces sp. ID05-47C]